MNTVYRKITDTIPLTPEELADAANFLPAHVINRSFTADMFRGKDSRIAGAGHCKCGGNGEFVLLPPGHPDVISGEKRYMQCRKCGCWSHL